MSRNTDNILGLDQMMTDNRIILAFRDHITQDSLNGLYSMAEWHTNALDEERPVRKKLFNILVECLQNIVNHAYSCNHPEATTLLVLAKENTDFVVITANPIDNENLKKFTEKVDKINQIPRKKVREVYSDLLSKAEFSAKGGAGLGLLDIYKKSGNKLEYEVISSKKDCSILSLKVRVSSTIDSSKIKTEEES